jgi:hypothetical protein
MLIFINMFLIYQILTFFLYRSGYYKIGDQGYLEGAVNEDKLVKGLKCEIFIEVKFFMFILFLNFLIFIYKLGIRRMVII